MMHIRGRASAFQAGKTPTSPSWDDLSLRQIQGFLINSSLRGGISLLHRHPGDGPGIAKQLSSYGKGLQKHTRYAFERAQTSGRAAAPRREAPER